MLTATVLVLGLLAAGLHFYYHEPRNTPAGGLRSFEIEYLTPEEAAALLGEEPDRFRAPGRVLLPPAPPAGDDDATTEPAGGASDPPRL